MQQPPRDRDVLLVCAVAVAAGLTLIAIGAVLDGFDLLHRLTGKR